LKYIIQIIPLVLLLIYSCAAPVREELTKPDYPSELKIITRDQWGWQPADITLPQHQITKITLHHGGEFFAEDKDVVQYLKNLQSWSRADKGWMDIPYHFMIDLEGNIYEARSLNYPGDTNTDYDVRGHALICVMGNYEVQKLKKEQLKSVVDLIVFIAGQHNVSLAEIKAHKDYTSTLCPGKDFYRFIRNKTVHKLAAQKITGLKINYEELFTAAPKVKTGVEVLRERNFDVLKGKRVGLVTNPTGVDSKLKSTVDILFEAEDVNLTALFGPEHGVRGNYAAGEYVEFYIDEYTNIPVYSLYGKTRKPDKNMLKDIDVIVYDIQDIGCRSYTYISTMGLVMEAAAENNIEVVVLDRPNPLGGERVEGSLVEDGYYSFVSQFKIPYVYGLTCGELAVMLNEEKMLNDGIKSNLTVIPMEGWFRDMYFEETGLPWIPTSPHIPHLYSPFYYVASGIIGELRNAISIGVGYTTPFQTFAAEWIDSKALADRLNSLDIKGVIFRPVTYKPYYAFGQGINLNGVQIHITDFYDAELMKIQFLFMQAVKELHPDRDFFGEENRDRFGMFDRVLGSNKIREIFSTTYRYDSIRDHLETEASVFKEFSKKYFLYD
jgi:uncharacterized protein YbbC (DUF1343 family)